MHKTVVCSRTVAYLLHVYNCWGAALRGTVFARIYKMYFVFTSHVFTDMISDTGLQNFCFAYMKIYISFLVTRVSRAMRYNCTIVLADAYC